LHTLEEVAMAHPAFKQPEHEWDFNSKLSTPNKNELHLALDLPSDVASQIHEWAESQDWPEGTKLEDKSDYHVTIFYCESGQDQEKMRNG